MNIKNLLICPVCGGELTEEMKCAKCGKQYEFKNDVYNVLYENMGEDYIFSTWDIDENDLEKTAKEYEEFHKEYIGSLNKETLKAQEKQSNYVDEQIKKMHGTVLDIATGRGMFLEEILSCENKDLSVICSDIDARMLATTKLMKKTDDRVAFLGTDGRHLALKDESMEHVASFVGIANMPETEQVVREIYRVLKKGGSFLYKGMFLDTDSKSYEMAKEYGVGCAVDMETLSRLFEETGFSKVERIIVSEAVWTQNPYDGLPLDGDVAKYGVIIAYK